LHPNENKTTKESKRTVPEGVVYATPTSKHHRYEKLFSSPISSPSPKGPLCDKVADKVIESHTSDPHTFQVGDSTATMGKGVGVQLRLPLRAINFLGVVTLRDSEHRQLTELIFPDYHQRILYRARFVIYATRC
jgi:hypothetical protein